MPRYTMRVTWPDQPHRTDDYVFRVDGKDAGRCYFHYTVPATGHRWHWTVYGSTANGDELTLEEAQARFKQAFERGYFGDASARNLDS